jgi:hypothetical protein
MPYYAVESGNVFRCVLADDVKSACVAAVTLHCNDQFTEECSPGAIFHVAEFGQSEGDSNYILATHVIDAGGFKVE